MICRKCNNEFDDKLKLCPHCGESYSDDYFSKMLEHAMSENTRSAEEMDKLRASLKKKKKNRRRNIFIAVLVILLAAACAFGAFYYFVLGNKGGNRIFRGGFDGNIFSVYDESGNEIRTVSGGKYTKTEYTPDGAKASSMSYSGFVSFERFDYKDGMLKREYTFDGIKNYLYKSYEYEYSGVLPVRAVYESNGINGMTENTYDESDNLIGVKNYDFESDKRQEYIYDSEGRLIAEKNYDLSGQLIYNKQYSYKSDGTLYLSSVNEINDTDEGGTAVNYILTMLNEDGTKSGATVNTPEGYEISKIEYTYDSGKLKSEKTTNDDGSGVSTVEYTYNDHGNVSCKKINEGGSKREVWYTYKYHENGAVALKAEAPSEKSEDYTSYITYDSAGRELKNITAVNHEEYKYNADGKLAEKSNYSPSAAFLGKTAYVYENGILKSETDYDENGNITDIREYLSDENGNVVSCTGSTGTYAYVNSYNEFGDLTDTKTYKLVSYVQYEYGHNGFVIKETAFNELNSFVSEIGYKRLKDGKISDKYTYDSNGNILTHVKFHYDDNGDQTGLTTYDRDGEKTGEAEISCNDKTKEITLENKDMDGNVLYRVLYNYSSDKPSLKISGTVSGSEYENVYKYNENGDLASITYTRGGKVVSKETYSYNETGNIIKSTSERGEGAATGKSVYKYEYDGVYLKSSTAAYPDGSEGVVSYGIDENKKPYIVSGDK